ncbi:hypothetical protein [Helicobacter suis]|uniref:hypothetical protein n=1 Tax=Helicobacter suis TaxID=104628 RepID=UPI0013D83E14|nr:hypothetical protein [Helicobacter suis]
MIRVILWFLVGLLVLGCSLKHARESSKPTAHQAHKTTQATNPRYPTLEEQRNALTQIKQWLKDFMQPFEQGQYTTLLYPKQEELANSNWAVKYRISCPDNLKNWVSTTLLSAYGEVYKNYKKVSAKGMCLGIISPQGKLSKGFCLKNFTKLSFFNPNQGIRLLRFKMSRFIPSTPTLASHSKPVILAFRIAKDNAFYLYSFTECEDFEQKRCHLFYKQPRDDPNNDHKFPLQAINNQLLESLKDKKRVFRFRGEALQSSMDYIYMQGELYTLRLIGGILVAPIQRAKF